MFALLYRTITRILFKPRKQEIEKKFDKPCIACKYYVSTSYGSMCDNENTKYYVYSSVYGQHVYRKPCRQLRGIFGKCGPSGKYFERKKY